MTEIIVALAYGGPEHLSLQQIDPPEPGPGEVAIRVRAAAVNPIDVKAYSGLFGTEPANLPMRLGAEAAGTVTALGPGVDVDGVGVGSDVIAFRAGGAYATDLVVPADAVIAKPVGLDWGEAAGLPVGGTTAVHALTAAQVAEGDTVLVHAAAGGVGLMVVQLATLRGARVIGTASERHHDLLRRLGVVPVEYGDGLANRVRAAAPEGVHAALDLVGTDEAVDTSLELVADRDRIVTIAAFGRAGDAGIQLLGGGPGADPGEEIRKAARPELVELAGSGRLRVFVDARYPLADAAEAHRRISGPHGPGKIVLIP